MFNKLVDDRLSLWADHRRSISNSNNPLQDVWEFWRHSPYIPYNNKIDPFNKRDWPTPWEIIVHNQYDDFTKALMIGYSLKLSKRFKESKIEIKTLVNDQKTCYYNIVCVDDCWAINYNDNGPVNMEDIPDSFYLENLIELNGTW
jgi:hypothetical protein